MRETVLLIGHGSRDEEGNQEVRDFADFWQQQNPALQLETCFIELAEPLLADGLRRAGQQAERVIALPLILNAAGHVKQEIPEAIRQARLEMPQVAFHYGRHLGCEEVILKLLRRRLHSAMVNLDMPDPQNTAILLLGRGSSDMNANAEVARMARWIFETTRHDMVEYAFTGVTEPKLEGMIQRMVRLGMMQIIILPYYLFTGRLIKRITRQVERLRQQYPQVAIAQAGYLGINHALITLMEQRLQQARTGGEEKMMECDCCKFSQLASAEAGHSHCSHRHDP
ncbi:MAG: sirohydrochlorin chelatase [Magnetococcales bacterium]|nr:sirohydrochlorin chelatase [Magnetococcales bacterium]